MKTYITSDLHFGHANIQKFCPETRSRFADVERHVVVPDVLVTRVGKSVNSLRKVINDAAVVTLARDLITAWKVVAGWMVWLGWLLALLCGLILAARRRGH